MEINNQSLHEALFAYLPSVPSLHLDFANKLLDSTALRASFGRVLGFKEEKLSKSG